MNEKREKTVHIARQPGGGHGNASVEIPVSKLSGFRTDTKSGGRGERHYWPELYAYTSCENVSGTEFGHSGTHGDCPHSIRVCVIGAPDDEFYQELCEQYDVHKPTPGGIEAEREEVKAKILERLGANDGPDTELRSRQEHFIPSSRFDQFRENVPLILEALYEDTTGFDTHPHLDLKTGEVVMSGSYPDEFIIGQSQERFEELGRGDNQITQREVNLLQFVDLLEIAEQFLRSKGFKVSADFVELN